MADKAATRRRRMLAAARDYRAMWDLVPRPFQVIITIAIANLLRIPGPIVQLGQAVFS